MKITLKRDVDGNRILESSLLMIDSKHVHYKNHLYLLKKRNILNEINDIRCVKGELLLNGVRWEEYTIENPVGLSPFSEDCLYGFHMVLGCVMLSTFIYLYFKN